MAQGRVKLTKRLIDALNWNPQGGASQFLWDSEQRGLGVRAFPSGEKSFVFDYMSRDGTRRRVTIGRFGKVTLDVARKEVTRLAADVLNGKDPADQRRTKREAVTVRRFAEEYIRRHARPRKKTWREDQRRLDSNILPVLGNRKLSSVRRSDIAALHSQIGTRGAPYEANRTVALLKVMRSVAIEWGYLPEDTPQWKIKPFAERKRDVWVTPEQLPALLAAIAAEPSTYVRGALELALHTGMRRGEVLGLRWQDVDLTRREIHLPDTKAGRPFVVHLSADASAILADLPRMLGNPYVFCSERTAGTHIHDFKEPWERVRARMWLALHPDQAAELRARADAIARESGGLAEPLLLNLANSAMKERGEVLRFHDVRRTVGSMLALAGASLPLIGKVLNHSNASTTQGYAWLLEDAPRAALEGLAERIRKARGGVA